MKRYDLIVIGAGPAGLSAAIQAAKYGAEVAVFDENERPGGQLFKQIHKFFGSKEHRAKIRGFQIGKELLAEAQECKVHVHLNATVVGLYENKEILVREGDVTGHYKGDAVIAATGARENMIPFEGWTLPGVLGAGAAQTMMNLHGVWPGSKVLMVGTGNVGLVVSYQLMQAGVKVEAIVDAAPRVGGYGVHASKIARAGVPFYLSHTVVKALGTDHVEKAVIAQVDSRFQPIPGTEKELEVDTVCMAVGLSPMSQILAMAGCDTTEKGGTVPVVNEYLETSLENIFAAGDVAGIEEASSAMITGRIAGTAAAFKLGYLEESVCREEIGRLKESLQQLHEGMFSPQNRGKCDIKTTDEGIDISRSLLKQGYIEEQELSRFPGVPGKKIKGLHPVIECTQNIPCNPCQDACKFGCIKVGDKITRLPEVNPDATCAGCGKCVASCSGQAIFLIDEDYEEAYGTVTMAYEFLPYPAPGTKGTAYGRDGKAVCEAEVVSCRLNQGMDHTALLTIKVPKDMVMRARFFRAEEETR